LSAAKEECNGKREREREKEERNCKRVKRDRRENVKDGV